MGSIPRWCWVQVIPKIYVNNGGGLCLHGTHSIGIKGLVIDYGEGAGGGATKWKKWQVRNFLGPPLKTG